MFFEDGPDPVGPELDLAGRLLARDVEDLSPPRSQAVQDLQQQGRLADARIASHEDGRAGHDAPAEDPVHLLEARFQPGLLVGLDGIDGTGFLVQLILRRHAGVRRLRRLLGKAVPLAAAGAFPDPLGRLIPAVLTEKGGFLLLFHSPPAPRSLLTSSTGHRSLVTGHFFYPQHAFW